MTDDSNEWDKMKRAKEDSFFERANQEAMKKLLKDGGPSPSQSSNTGTAPARPTAPSPSKPSSKSPGSATEKQEADGE